MKLKEEYKEFYKSAQYDDLRSNRIFYKKLFDIIKALDDKDTLEDGLAALEDSFDHINSTKQKYEEVYNDFIHFLKEKGYKVKNNLRKNFKTDERRVSLIKFLQEPKTKDDVINDYLIKEETYKNDIEELRKGIYFCGNKNKVDLTRFKHKKNTIDEYNVHSTCNPIGLALNMTELYCLLHLIPNEMKNEHLLDAYNSILDKIYPQLSRYALKLMKLEDLEINDEMSFYKVERSYLANPINQLMYVQKREELCTIIHSKDGKQNRTTGYIRGICSDYFILEESSNKEIEIFYGDFIMIEDFFEKYYK